MSLRALARPASSATPPMGAIVRRQCACGKHAGGGECEECQRQREALARKPEDRATPAIAPAVVHAALRSPGHPLDSMTRMSMESRLGHDFSQIRVHADSLAAESAMAVHALAYTVGRDVVFAAERYAPRSAAGQDLLAHELTHVAQQGGAQRPSTVLHLRDPADPAERQAEAAENGVLAERPYLKTPGNRNLQRKLNVEKAGKPIPNPGRKGLVQTNADTIQGYLDTLCLTGAFTVGADGDVKVEGSVCDESEEAAPAGHPKSCGCVCDIIKSPHKWSIEIDDADWPSTGFRRPRAARRAGKGSGGSVDVPSPNSARTWGAETAGGKELDVVPWLVLGHELCGHAWLGDQGKEEPKKLERGEGGHQEAVARENEVRAEHGIDLRGSFKDPNCGESYWRSKKNSTVRWSEFRLKCQRWRLKYNREHKTKYKITDTIP